MRLHGKLDANHAQVVKQLRAKGVLVLSLASLGNGAPDLACGWGGRVWLFELKDPAKPPSARKLTPDEAAWHSTWTGHVEVAFTARQILNRIGWKEQAGDVARIRRQLGKAVGA